MKIDFLITLTINLIIALDELHLKNYNIPISFAL